MNANFLLQIPASNPPTRVGCSHQARVGCGNLFRRTAMKEIKLTQGQVAIVDDWRFDELNQYKWFAAWNSHTKSFFAMRSSSESGKKKKIKMHAIVAGTPRGMITDHINHDTLDNQEKNLRVCTNSQNMMNRGKQADNTSGFKGVFKNKRGWQAQIKVNQKHYCLGTFSIREDAARAYDNAAKRLHGEFAKLNFCE